MAVGPTAAAWSSTMSRCSRSTPSPPRVRRPDEWVRPDRPQRPRRYGRAFPDRLRHRRAAQVEGVGPEARASVPGALDVCMVVEGVESALEPASLRARSRAVRYEQRPPRAPVPIDPPVGPPRSESRRPVDLIAPDPGDDPSPRELGAVELVGAHDGLNPGRIGPTDAVADPVDRCRMGGRGLRVELESLGVDPDAVEGDRVDLSSREARQASRSRLRFLSLLAGPGRCQHDREP